MSDRRTPTRFVLLCPALASMAIAVHEGSAGTPLYGWRPMPMVSAELLARGVVGGEGGQWPLTIEIAPADPTFLMYGTDVGGVYRSLDGGTTWRPANFGYTPRGACDFAIDPNNPDRVLAVGANSTTVGGDVHGVWYSTDRAASWTQASAASGSKPMNNLGFRDVRDQLAFDPTTYNAANDRTDRVYWAYDGSGDEDAAVYRSDDGGASWSLLPATASIAGIESAAIAVHPTSGFVYLATSSGVYRSTNGGNAFSRRSATGVTGITVSPAQPNSVWAAAGSGILRSTNSGTTFALVSGSGYPPDNGQVNQVEVSPVDPDRLVVDARYANFQDTRYASDNAGQTWTTAGFDNTDAFLPYNPRAGDFAWSPTDAATVFSVGGDWVTRSTDGGLTYAISNDGNSGIVNGDYFAFNAADPDVLFFGSQDYNGALTTDGGATWAYVNMSGFGFGGFVYGGYAASPGFLFGAHAPAGFNGGRFLRTKAGVGGERSDTGLEILGLSASLGDPFNPDILFAGEYRTVNGGETWQQMPGCDGVLWVSASTPGLMLGVNEPATVVRSFNSGASWTPLATLPDDVDDVAFADGGAEVWATTKTRRLFRIPLSGGVNERTALLPPDQQGNRGVRTIAVDPTNPDVIYAGVAWDVYKSNAAIVRSIDAGVSWHLIAPTSNPAGSAVPFGPEGPTEPTRIRVHPGTGEVWVATSCFGWWRADIPGCPLDVAAPRAGHTDFFDLAAVIQAVERTDGPVDPAAVLQYLDGVGVPGCPQ